MNGIPDCCGLCDILFTVVCATKHDQTIDKMMLRVGRPSWCPIVGVLPDEHGDLVDRDEVKKKMIHYGFRAIDMTATEFCEDELQTVIAAERKDDEQIH